MSSWSDIQNPSAVDTVKPTMEVAKTTEIAGYGKLMNATIVTLDGRIVPAMVHQGSRSVFPKVENTHAD